MRTTTANLTCTRRAHSCSIFVDTRTNRVVWRGWAEGSVDGVIDNQQWLEQRVDEAVRRILARLPRVS